MTTPHVSQFKVIYQQCASLFDVHPNFPKPGTIFRSMGRLLKEPEILARIHSDMEREFCQKPLPPISTAAGIASRGHYLEEGLAAHSCLHRLPITKGGSQPGVVLQEPVVKEYGDAKNPDLLEVKPDLVDKQRATIICDDLLATGDSAAAAARLILRSGGTVAAFCFFGVIPECNGVARLQKEFPTVDILTACVFDKVVLQHDRASFSEYLSTFDSIKNLVTTELVQPEEGTPGKILLMAHPTLYSHVRELMGEFPEVFEFIEIKWGRFDDGMPDLELPSCVEDMEDRDVVFLMNNHNLPTLVEQFFVQRVLPRQRIRSLQFVNLYFATETHERRNVRKAIASADTMFGLISAGVPQTKQGPPIGIFADIHAEASEFFPTDDIGTQFLDALTRFILLLDLSPRERHPLKQPFIGFADAGAYKRFIEIIKKFKLPVMIFDKTRDGDKRIVKFIEYVNWPKDAAGNPLKLEYGIVVDDLALSGGTLLSVGKIMKSMGVKFLDCYVTHARFPKKAYRQFFRKYNPTCPFKRVYCGTTVPDVQKEILLEGANDEYPNPFYFLPTSTLVAQKRKWMHKRQPARHIRVLVTSDQSLKLEATAEAFAYVFPYDHIHVAAIKSKSGVPEQPMNGEGFEGSLHRMSHMGYMFEHCAVCVKGREYRSTPTAEQIKEHYCLWMEKRDRKNPPTQEEYNKFMSDAPVDYTVSIEDEIIGRPGNEKSSTEYHNRGILTVIRGNVGADEKTHEKPFINTTEEVSVLLFPKAQALLEASRKERETTSAVTYGSLLCEYLQLDPNASSDWFLETHCDTRTQVLKVGLIENLYRGLAIGATKGTSGERV